MRRATWWGWRLPGCGPGGQGGRLRGARALLVMLVGAVSLVPAAGGDGGQVALHATAGAYTVTLFTTPVPLATGVVEFSLLVQAAEGGSGAPVSGQALDKAQASGRLELGSGEGIPLRFTRGAAAGSLLTASVMVPAAGEYGLTLTVAAPGAARAEFHTTLPVAANHGRRTTVVLAVLLPLAVVLLFLLNQQAKARAYTRS